MARGRKTARILCVAAALLLLSIAAAEAGEAADALTRLQKARKAGKARAVTQAVLTVPKAYNESDDEEVQAELLRELAETALDENIGDARIDAVRAIAALDDADAAHEELAYLLPYANQDAIDAFEVAVVEAVGAVAHEDGLESLLELLESAEHPILAAASARALCGYATSRPWKARLLAALMPVVAKITPKEGRDGGKRWQAVETALVNTLQAATGRGLGIREALRLWKKGGGSPDLLMPLAAEVTEALADPDSEACLAEIDRMFRAKQANDEIRRELEAVAQRSNDWRIVSLALRALGAQDTKSAPPKGILRLQKHKRWQVRLALAEALFAFQHREGVDVLIELLGDRRMRVRVGAAKSLSALTGVDHGLAQGRWAAWRRENRGYIKFLPRGMEPAADRHQREYAFSHNAFFGARIHSDRVVFVLDKSDSMYYGLYDQVVEEVGLFLASALPTTFFGVIEFAEEPKTWRRKLSPVNAANTEQLLTFLHRAKPYGPTNIMDSLRIALETSDVDTIVLLSDGLPNRGKATRPDEILTAVAQVNRYARVAVHTLLMEEGRRFPHDGPKGEDKPPLDDEEIERRRWIREEVPNTELGALMKALADQNEGTFDVVFADAYMPPDDAVTRPSTDK